MKDVHALIVCVFFTGMVSKLIFGPLELLRTFFYVAFLLLEGKLFVSIKLDMYALFCLGRAAESFSRPRGKLRIEAPCERREQKIFFDCPL